jgi:hypothetical protein
MQRIEEASSGQFPSRYVSEAVQFPHASTFSGSVFNHGQADKV